MDSREYWPNRTCTAANPALFDRNHNVPGSRLAEANPERVAVMRQQMDQVPYLLDKDSRRLESLGGSRANNHVHVVVEPDVRPEKISAPSGD